MTIHSVGLSARDALANSFAYSENGLAVLFEKLPTETFASGDTIFFQGDAARHVFEIAEGVVRLSRVLVDGRRVICGFLFEGDVIGFSQREHFLYSAEAVNGVQVRRLGRRSLDDLIERAPSLRPLLFSRMCDEMEAVQQQMVLLSCKTAEERVCSFLVDLMDRQTVPGEYPITIDLPMSRLDIGDYLGMTIETVSRNLSKLAKRGILTDVERFTLCVSKPRLLVELAGEVTMNGSPWRQSDTVRHPGQIARH